MSNNDIIVQASRAALRGEHIAREKDAFIYICAMDRGDFETVNKIMERAEKDPELQRIIDELDEAAISEEEVFVSDEERHRVHTKIQHLMKQYFEEA